MICAVIISCSTQPNYNSKFYKLYYKIQKENTLLNKIIKPTVKVNNGSGIIFKFKKDDKYNTAYILTAAHVILRENMLSLLADDIKNKDPKTLLHNKIPVFLYKYKNGRSILDTIFLAEYVHANISQDLAIIKIYVPKGIKIHTATLEKYNRLYLGETLYLSGCGMRGSPMINQGIYVGKDIIKGSTFGAYSGGAIFGDSGGAVFNKDFNVIGIISCIKMFKYSKNINIPLFHHSIFHITNYNKIQEIISNG